MGRSRTFESTAQRQLAQACAHEAPGFFDKLMRAGLYRTGQLMHDVVRSLGYELAELGAAFDKEYECRNVSGRRTATAVSSATGGRGRSGRGSKQPSGRKSARGSASDRRSASRGASGSA